MEKFKELVSMCRASVEIGVNNHRDYYLTVKEYIEEAAMLDEELLNELDGDVYKKMIETNTIIEVHAYPNTPIGSYKLYHYDIDKAVELMIETIKQN